MGKKREKVVLTVVEIEDRLEEAALTLRRLPAKDGPREYGSSWPDVVRSRFTAYGFEEARMRVVPSAAQIQRMEEAIDWLRLLERPEDRHIVWMRAENYRWRPICSRVGFSRAHAWRRWSAALLTIQKRLANPAARRETGMGVSDRATGMGGAPKNAQGAKKRTAGRV